jgi:hypothetical protein
MKYVALVSCTGRCVDTLLVSACLVARVDSAGKPACEECGRRLTSCKGKLYKRNPGYVCQRCFNYTWRTPVSGAIPAPIAIEKQSRKRRASSDPGESPEPAAPSAITRRIAAPKSAATYTKQHNTRRKEHIMRLLDETHARRVATEAAATHH